MHLENSPYIDLAVKVILLLQERFSSIYFSRGYILRYDWKEALEGHPDNYITL